VTTPGRPNGKKLFANCCKNGAISFTDPDAHIPNPPPLLRRLFTDNSSDAKKFRHNLRLLNSALSYTSVGCRSDPRLRPEEYQYIFQLHPRTQTRKIVDRNLEKDSTLKKDVEQWMKDLKEKNND
jgi:hypothetical protein